MTIMKNSIVMICEEHGILYETDVHIYLQSGYKTVVCRHCSNNQSRKGVGKEPLPYGEKYLLKKRFTEEELKKRKFECTLKWQIKNREKLGDGYVKRLIEKRWGFDSAPPEFIETYRTVIAIKRQKWQIQRKDKEGKENGKD